MNKERNILAISTSIILLILIIITTPVYANASESFFSAQCINFDAIKDKMVPNSPIIKWRYKVIKGKLYKRQYNYSYKKWIGEWELVE